MFDHYGVIRASLQYVQLDLFKHRACVYSSYWKVCHLPPCVIFVSILGRPPCPDSTRKILMNAMKFVMYEKPLFWIEAMSILGKADEVSAILEEVIEWPALAVCPEFVFYNTILRLTGQTLDPMNELTLFIRDAVRFISAFLMPISQHPPQIYLSALPFTFERSLVDEKFRPRFPNISDSRPSQWPMIIFTAEHNKQPVECIVRSPDEKTFTSISVPLQQCATVYVCDSETGHCISGPFELKIYVIGGLDLMP